MIGLRHTLVTAACALDVIAATELYAQQIERDGQTITLEEHDMTLEDAQATMDPIRLIEAYVVDKTLPRNARGGWSERPGKIYLVGQQIDAVIRLTNVGKHHPGLPENAQEMELYINIRNPAGEVVFHAKPVHTFRATQVLQDPLQQDYFTDRYTVSARVPAPGRYSVGFVFLDKTRAPDKQVELEVPLDVVVEDPTARGQLTDLTQLWRDGKISQNDSLLRCAGYFHAKVELVGQKGMTPDLYAQTDARVRYFLHGAAVIDAATSGETVTDAVMDQAVEETIAGMTAFSLQYMARMMRNLDAGQHPWDNDVMLVRDGATCNIIYDSRD
ncbi:hypothetical protein [Actibacterium sp. 188UL27-1]|uniref:hypothetical protein n=1 Tax=Actibacterium sp. 188UL27-1 TaxID=2786961 RepID=UPI001956FD1C|nr:hypothetical protein [Actibacterium sp. 188UL27-1]MBM7069206.1 hypothetical protein [Actibacterium sp. 188UL27-1]